MELVFDDTKKRLFKKRLGDNFFENHSKMGQGIRFSRFWSLAFESSDNPREVVEFLYATESYLNEGPVKKWVESLRCKFIFFIWSYSNLTLHDLGTVLKLKDKSFLNYLFFLASEDGYSNHFFLKEEIEVRSTLFEEFESLNAKDNSTSVTLSNLELGLFPSWNAFLNEMEKDAKDKLFKQSGGFFKYILGYSFTAILGVLIIFFFIYTSSNEAKRVLQKLTISIPSFENIDVLNTFDEPRVSQAQGAETFRFDEEDDLQESSERFDTESEIEYIELEEIKNKFSSLGREKTEFEEETKGVFRETRYGYSTVYRLMIETADSFSFLTDYAQLKDEFNFEKAGKVEPGLFIPGGNYFNLLVDSDKFRDLLKKLKKYKPMIYASKSKGKKIPGKTKVFIFVNKI